MTVGVAKWLQLAQEAPVTPSGLARAEEFVRFAVDWIVLLIEFTGAVTITIGTALAVVMGVRAMRHPLRLDGFTRIRLTLGSYLVLGLEFQLAADVLKTAVAPTFREIGQLAAIAAIRTLLNYFLTKEIDADRVQLASQGQEPRPLPSPRH